LELVLAATSAAVPAAERLEPERETSLRLSLARPAVAEEAADV
jgi:hypothetical protein